MSTSAASLYGHSTPPPWQVERLKKKQKQKVKNDIWTIPGERGLTLDEAVELGSGDLPNYHAYQLRDVIGAVRASRAPAVTGIDGYRVVAVIQGVYESTRTGRPVKLTV